MEASLQASLDTSLKNLKLPTILSEYSDIAMVALEGKYTYEQYLLKLSKREVEQRFNNRVKYLLKQAKFPKLKTIIEYDFSKVEISKESIIQLCHGSFLGDSNNIICFLQPVDFRSQKEFVDGICFKYLKGNGFFSSACN